MTAASTAHLSSRVRLMFAFGQIPEGVQSTAFGFFLLFYYNQVLGLSGAYASAAIVIAQAIDAVIDPIVGNWSDRTRGVWGRRHPFMYAAAIPFALCFYLLFTPPPGLPQLELFLWLVTFSTLTRATQSFYSIPHTAMTAELSMDYHERTRLSALRSIFGSVGTLMVFLIGLQLYFRGTPEYPNGQLNPEAYPLFAATFAVVLVVGIWISALGTHSQIPYLPQATTQPARFSVLQVLREAGQAFSLRSFQVIVLTAVLWGMTMGMVSALSIYLGTLYFQFSLQLIGLSFPASVIGGFMGAALATPLARRIPEKKTLYIAGLAWYGLWNTGPIILSLLGLAPDPGEMGLFYLVMTANAVSAMGIGLLGVMQGSMIADITDEHEARHGSRNEGIYYAAASFAAKAIGGFGVIISGIVVDIAQIQRNATVETISAESLQTLALAMGPGVLIMIALTVLVASAYRLTREEHSRIRRVIEAGHQPAHST
ncbi:MAG: MFS transporter [Pseudomonadales bacterium]